MRYYRRYYTDGRCVIICTRCFATIGSAAANGLAGELEKQHVCGPRLVPKLGETALRTYADFRSAQPRDRLVDFLRRTRGWYAAVMFVAIALAVYALPNLVELATLRYVSPWVVNIVFGDLIGCLCLVLVLRMPRTGVILYLALALVEGWLYATGKVSPATLAWITDAVPTLVVAGRVAQLRATTAQPPKTA
jgi:hypothetical protein